MFTETILRVIYALIIPIRYFRADHVTTISALDVYSVAKTSIDQILINV